MQVRLHERIRSTQHIRSNLLLVQEEPKQNRFTPLNWEPSPHQEEPQHPTQLGAFSSSEKPQQTRPSPHTRGARTKNKTDSIHSTGSLLLFRGATTQQNLLVIKRSQKKSNHLSTDQKHSHMQYIANHQTKS